MRIKRTTAGLIALGMLLALPGAGAIAGPKGGGKDGRVWRSVDLPFSTSFRVPKGVSMVRATADMFGDETVSVSLKNATTLRPRCYPVIVKTWSSLRTGKGTCEALTAVDKPGALWQLDVSSTDASSAKSVSIEFVKGRTRGYAGRLNLNRLSMRKYQMTETKDFFITSFDGTKLHAEITRPKTNRKVPTVVISSPYFAGAGPYSPDLVNDWGPRGYAILNVDVRGFNQSEGCVEVWGRNEQRDQKEIVQWVARQPWSDNRVAVMGKSYVGTTPIEAAVMAPKALKAIIAVAPVATAYEDWHFGGVPNGEQLASPLAYQALEGTGFAPGFSDPLASIVNVANGMCDPTLAARASDPRAIYDDFYKERDFAAKAKKINAAVMYTHGYEDANVKINVANKFFNRLDVPHLGLFGHFDHIWAPRPDTEVLLLAWVDQYLKGKNLGLKRLPNAIVENNLGQEHGFARWPTPTARPANLNINFDKGTLGGPARKTEGTVALDSTGASGQTLTLKQKVTRSFEVAGTARLAIKGTLTGSTNGHVAAFLYDKSKKGQELITFGMFNLAHRKGHHRYEPVVPGETVRASLPFLTNDHVFKKGHTMVLEIRAAQPTDSAAVTPSEPGVLTLESGRKGTKLVAPRLR